MADFFLALLQAAANGGDFECDVTLLVSGQLVSGRVVGGRKWFEVAEPSLEVSMQPADGVKRAMRVYVEQTFPTDDEREAADLAGQPLPQDPMATKFLNLLNAHVLSAVGASPVGVPIRIDIESVDAWFPSR